MHRDIQQAVKIIPLIVFVTILRIPHLASVCQTTIGGHNFPALITFLITPLPEGTLI